MLKCAICGKEIEWSGRGRKKKFCSMHCKNMSHKNDAREYYRRRMQEDAEFRERRLAASRYHSSRYAQQLRRETLEKLAEEVSKASTKEEIYALLDEKVRSVKASNA